MEVLVLNEKLESVAVIDSFESLIWTDRFIGFGDFELYTPMNYEIFKLVKPDYYLWSRESEHVMIIENNQIESDVENGNHLTTSGRSLESILDRRIVWNPTLLQGNFQNAIKKLLDENIISPTIANRKINNFAFEASTDSRIISLTIDAQFYGENLYDVVKELCESQKLGFKVTLTSENSFLFKLYFGVDRSYDQIIKPYVVFSPNFDNIINSNYIESKKTLKTISLVAGEGEEANRKMTTATIDGDGGKGLNRRELFTDAAGVSSEVDGVTLSSSEYIAQLVQKGKDELGQNIFLKSFEGEVESTQMYKYREDFFMGDIMQIANEYGIEAKVRLTEIVTSQSLTGTEVVPTFSTVE